MKKRYVTHFFDNEFTDQAAYINFSKIPSIMGYKVTANKVLNTILSENITKWQKVEVISSLTALKTLYLGGSSNIDNVIVNNAVTFTGSNNISLIETKGDFGGRLDKTAAASRYIFARKGPDFDTLFNKDDLNVLKRYNFEGQDIEYQFLSFNIPIILCNGVNSALGSGHSSNILPRNPTEILKYLKYNLEGKNTANKPFQNKPFYKGFMGNIIQGDNSKQWIIEGVIERKTKSLIEIKEVPVGETYKSYIKKLEKLVEQGVIKEYTDLCDPKEDIFYFKIKTDFAFSKNTDEQILKILKLRTTVTENYTLNDENNKIKTYDSVNEIFWHYYELKLKYIQKRKDYLIEKIQNDIKLDVSKYTFISMIVNDELIINKRKKKEIEKDMDTVDRIIKRDDSYDYLLNLSIGTLTEERMKKLMQDIKTQNTELKRIQKISLENMWLDDLKGVTL